MDKLKSINFVFLIVILVFTQPVFTGLSSTNSIRSLMVGDTFTPAEMLPVAKKLIEKVPDPGMGKGIVSSSKKTEEFADRLFETFFMTSKRYVTLTDFDISGLDALQALALSGEVIANSSTAQSFTEAPSTMKEMMFEGQLINVEKVRKCKYKLLSKKLDSQYEIKRRGIELAKKLSKKRRLVVKNRKTFKEPRNVLTIEKSGGQQKEPLCTWRYECNIPGDLDSCQLHTQCMPNENIATKKYNRVSEKVDSEKEKSLYLFRKMLGLTAVDEEVEKILESRILQLKPSNLGNDERVESLREFFNNIIIAQAGGEFTTPSVTITKDYGKTQSDGSNQPTESAINDGNSQNIDSYANGRKGRFLRRIYYTKRTF